MIAAVATTLNENDIIEASIRHLLAEGVDLILVADGRSTDGTRETLRALERETDLRVMMVDDDKSFHDQPYWINHLASLAARAGAEWIIPFDADEFWFANSPTDTLASALDKVTPEISQIVTLMVPQRDWWYRNGPFKPLPKIAYRYSPSAWVGPGNHSVSQLDGLPAHNILTLREIQFRDFDHFKRKVSERLRTLDPSFGPEFGRHIRQFADLDEQGLKEAWQEIYGTPVVWDPIPSRTIPPATLAPRLRELSMAELFDQFENEASDFAGHMTRLRDIVHETNARLVIEAGVNSGVSTVALLSGLEKTGGWLCSCDIRYPRMRHEVAMHPQWLFRLCDSLTFKPPFSPNSPFTSDLADVAFIDTSHTLPQTVEELKHFEPMVRSGGCLVLHDSEMSTVHLAIRHFLHVLDERGRTATRVETYTHSQGLTVIWLP